MEATLQVLTVLAFAAAAWRVGAVSLDGALAGIGVAGLLTWRFGWGGFVMLLVFVVLGTTISERSGRRRDAVQVLCNGGAAAIAAACGWPAAAAGALAAALSDTAASELGKRYGGVPRQILFGGRLEPGRDGGMSWLGTIAGLAFAWPVPLVAWAFGILPDFRVVSWIAAAGMIGNLIDSVLGATIQRRLGARGNDWVNLAATTAAATLA
ncbi:MAG: DUF92 domain-containing protein [Planctomycetota bacterium]